MADNSTVEVEFVDVFSNLLVGSIEYHIIAVSSNLATTFSMFSLPWISIYSNKRTVISISIYSNKRTVISRKII